MVTQQISTNFKSNFPLLFSKSKSVDFNLVCINVVSLIPCSVWCSWKHPFRRYDMKFPSYMVNSSKSSTQKQLTVFCWCILVSSCVLPPTPSYSCGNHSLSRFLFFGTKVPGGSVKKIFSSRTFQSQGLAQPGSYPLPPICRPIKLEVHISQWDRCVAHEYLRVLGLRFSHVCQLREVLSTKSTFLWTVTWHHFVKVPKEMQGSDEKVEREI